MRIPLDVDSDLGNDEADVQSDASLRTGGLYQTVVPTRFRTRLLCTGLAALLLTAVACRGGGQKPAVAGEAHSMTLTESKKKPVLFCFMVMRSTGYEPQIVKEQVRRGVGIFDCDEYVVIADSEIHLGEGPRGNVTTILNPVPQSATGGSWAMTNSFLNVENFIQAWDKFRIDGRIKDRWPKADWIVKLDPDAVFHPDALRQHLLQNKGAPNSYYLNCNKGNWAPPWPLLYGALEIFSKQAVQTYLAGQWRCKNELQWQGWGEDKYMSECMTHLGVQRAYDFHGLDDMWCKCPDGSPYGACQTTQCQEPGYAAYHPFKSVDGWFDCWRHSADCSKFDGKEDCTWTLDWNCPGQGKTSSTKGTAKPDGSNQFKCCCSEKLWKNATCDDADCSWTKSFNCPGQAPGTIGKANADTSRGYQCCCLDGGWKKVAR